MNRWFSGVLEGYYVSTPTTRPAVSQYGAARRYKLRIYRARINAAELIPEETEVESESVDAGSPELESAEPPVEFPEGCFFQPEIEDTHIMGLRSRGALEGHIYDVAVADLKATHSKKKGNKFYGRVVGRVWARVVLPEPEAEPEVTPEVLEGHAEAGAGEAAMEVASVDSAQTHADSAGPPPEEAVTPVLEENEEEALHAPVEEVGTEASSQYHFPLIILTAVLAAVLGAFGGTPAGALWLGAIVPVLCIRFLLSGLFEVDGTVRAFGALLIVVQVACLVVVLGDWFVSGCKALHLFAMAGICLTTVAAGLLPSLTPFLFTAGVLAMSLLGFFADVGTHCGPRPAFPALTPKDADSTRTNPDGSWPKRRPLPARSTP